MLPVITAWSSLAHSNVHKRHTGDMGMSQVGEGALEAVQRIEGEAAEMADERRRTESVVDGLRTMVEAAAAAAMHAESLAADALSHAKSEREELVAGLTSDLDVMHSKLSNTQVRSSLGLSPSGVCSTRCLGERCSGQRTSRVPAGLRFTERHVRTLECHQRRNAPPSALLPLVSLPLAYAPHSPCGGCSGQRTSRVSS